MVSGWSRNQRSPCGHLHGRSPSYLLVYFGRHIPYHAVAFNTRATTSFRYPLGAPMNDTRNGQLQRGYPSTYVCLFPTGDVESPPPGFPTPLGGSVDADVVPNVVALTLHGHRHIVTTSVALGPSAA